MSGVGSPKSLLRRTHRECGSLVSITPAGAFPPGVLPCSGRGTTSRTLMILRARPAEYLACSCLAFCPRVCCVWGSLQRNRCTGGSGALLHPICPRGSLSAEDVARFHTGAHRCAPSAANDLQPINLEVGSQISKHLSKIRCQHGLLKTVNANTCSGFFHVS